MTNQLVKICQLINIQAISWHNKYKLKANGYMVRSRFVITIHIYESVRQTALEPYTVIWNHQKWLFGL